jgi:hypothetical protein
MWTPCLGLWVLLISINSLVNGRQKWYYTGNFENEKLIDTVYEGTRIDLQDWYSHPTENKILPYCGGLVFAAFHTKESIENVTFNLNEQDFDFISNVTQIYDTTYAMKYEKVVSYKVYLSPNYGLLNQVPSTAKEEKIQEGTIENEKTENSETSSTSSTSVPSPIIMQAEIGLYDHDLDTFLQREWNNVTMGTLHAVTITLHPDTQIPTSPDHHQYHHYHQHQIMYMWDLFGRMTILQHTWQSYNNNNQQGIKKTEETSTSTSIKSLKILSYNLWNNNPAEWVYREKKYVMIYIIRYVFL